GCGRRAVHGEIPNTFSRLRSSRDVGRYYSTVYANRPIYADLRASCLTDRAPAATCRLRPRHPLARASGVFVMSTYSAKACEIKKKWLLIDAEGLVVGRLATIIATRLRCKHKPT